MRLAKDADKKRITDLLGSDIGNCIYIYMDLKKYGLDSDDLYIWVNEDETIESVVMKYHECVHIYSVGNRHVDEIRNLILYLMPQSIRGPKDQIEQLYIGSYLTNEYLSNEGKVYQFTEYRVLDDDRIERASVNDCEEIARLLFMDDDFRSNYTLDDLAEQLEERIINGTSRNLIIRDNGRLIAHIATFAEDEELAVTSGLIVHPNYRNYLYGTILESRLVNDLLLEGKMVFTFANEVKRIKFFRSMRVPECGHYMKLVKA